MDTISDIQVIPDQDVFKVMSQVILSAKKGLDCYFEATSIPLLMKVASAANQKIMSLRAEGARLRCVTEITPQNVGECKELMKSFQLFHTAHLTGSFLIADDREYVGYLVSNKGGDRLLRVLDESFVDAQKFLLNIMIDRALPASHRIREIGKGVGEEFIETINDPLRVRSLISNLLNSALYEVAVLFSTSNSFLMAESEGMLAEVAKISATGIKVRILVMHDESVKEISNRKLKVPDLNVQVNYLEQLLPTRITTLIIDQAKVLAVEVNDDSKGTFQEAIGLSTYSNSESTVFSNVSMFESLWMQSEVDMQNKARQAYFQLFKGLKLKDEIYNRRWKSGTEENKQK